MFSIQVSDLKIDGDRSFSEGAMGTVGNCLVIAGLVGHVNRGTE